MKLVWTEDRLRAQTSDGYVGVITPASDRSFFEWAAFRPDGTEILSSKVQYHHTAIAVVDYTIREERSRSRVAA